MHKSEEDYPNYKELYVKGKTKPSWGMYLQRLQPSETHNTALHTFFLFIYIIELLIFHPNKGLLPILIVL
jgi:hypothetical protein